MEGGHILHTNKIFAHFHHAVAEGFGLSPQLRDTAVPRKKAMADIANTQVNARMILLHQRAITKI